MHDDARTWGSFGTYIGQKRVNGRWKKDIALVCLVAAKMTARALPKKQRIPKLCRWKEQRFAYRICTDVVVSQPRLQLQAGAIVGPGDRVEFSGDRATLGVALDHPEFERCVTTAGHLFRGPGDVGQKAMVTSAGASVATELKRCVRAGGVDYALLRPLDPCDCDNLFEDLVRIGPAFVPQAADVGRQLFVLDGDTDSVATVCRGIRAQVQFGSTVLEDVILCDGVTRGGQSGAPLVDSDNRIWGFLIGLFDQFSVFMPAATLLREESARLA